MASTYKEEDLKQVQAAAAQTAQEQTQAAQQKIDTNLKGLSDAAKQNLSKYQAGYQQSDAVTAAQNYLQGLQQNKPQDYVSQYDADISAAYQQLINRQPFKYDLNADMLYQQYKDQYQTLGKQAMMDTMGQAAGLTGGYGNSYAATVGNQAYQGYLQQMNNLIPELYDRAANQYAMEGDMLMDRYNLAKDMDAGEYGKWQDAYNRWFNERAAAEDTYNTERGFDYGQYTDALSYWNNLAQAESDTYWRGQNQAYNLAMAMIQNGQTPNDELLYNANLTPADLAALQAMYAPKKRSGGSSPKQELTVAEMAEVAGRLYDSGGFEQFQSYLQSDVTGGSRNGDTLMDAVANTQRYKDAVAQEAAKRQAEQAQKEAARQKEIDKLIADIKNKATK